MKEVCEEKTGKIDISPLLSLFHPYPPSRWILTPIPVYARDRGERRKKSPRTAQPGGSPTPTTIAHVGAYGVRVGATALFPHSRLRRHWWPTGGPRREARPRPRAARFLPSPPRKETPGGTVANSGLLSFDRPGRSGFPGGSWQRPAASGVPTGILWHPAQTCGRLWRFGFSWRSPSGLLIHAPHATNPRPGCGSDLRPGIAVAGPAGPDDSPAPA